MQLTKQSMLTGRVHTRYIPMSRALYLRQYALWRGGAKIQDAFPRLFASDREFIMTGSTPAEWEEAFATTLGGNGNER
jgi:hypothetical protein